MRITVRRYSFLPTATLGHVYVNGVDSGLCSLEDVVRERADAPVEEWKIPGKTAIPAGVYKMIVDYSEHFKRPLPRLLDVPGFIGVRIHAGNTSRDTEGCILIGNKNVGKDFIGNSRVSFESLFAQINEAYLKNEYLEIEVTSCH